MRISNNQIRIVTLLLIFYYIVFAWLLHRSGYEHSESLFYAEKLKLLFEYKENTLLTLGTTYPSTFFISTIIFSPFGYMFAPIAASIVMMGVLFFLMAKDISISNLPAKTLFLCIAILFFLHPMFVFSAVSGRNVAGIMLFFYMLFRSLFNYYKSQTTYYLSLASIYLTGLIFTEINFIWMLLSFFPFIMLISIEGIKVAKGEAFVFQYYQALNNRSLRRKLANRTVALYLILFLLPLGAIYLFRTLNAAHAGDATYFLTSQYANWRVTGTTALNTILEGIKGSNIAMQTQIIFQAFTVFLAPLFVLSLVLFRGKIYELFTILTPLIFFSIILVDVKYYFTVEYYVIINLIGVAALTYFGAQRFGQKITSILLIGTTVLSLFAGFYYFNETNDQEEQAFLSTLTIADEIFETKKISELQQVAEYIETVATAKTPVLIDDASAFGIVAHLQTLDGLILPMQKSFVTVIENPALTAQYIVAAKRNNRLHNFTVLNAYNIGVIKDRLKLTTYRVFETNNWIIYSIR